MILTSVDFFVLLGLSSLISLFSPMVRLMFFKVSFVL